MQALQEHSLSCPYCGETIEVLLDCTIDYQQYIEDCFVCCRPIQFSVSVHGDGTFEVNATDENA
ncbi:CPXCG motif-containing cysteine-rich protein [Methylophaga sp.]|uniref:CPXCG motif-containing cysteine-rich protein n=1 Tax=Methylophaga sp. TaxID=2024840 RepID=UPI002719CDF4|nr:CPXCG motif-containing cysteine-rich protein [Methylophaga sp.]MDO8825513.1 CPXCG motif-containing cysteine-rich protein [Methylophaga sp.]